MVNKYRELYASLNKDEKLELLNELQYSVEQDLRVEKERKLAMVRNSLRIQDVVQFRVGVSEESEILVGTVIGMTIEKVTLTTDDGEKRTVIYDRIIMGD